MPFYDYYCLDCEDKFYVRHSMNEEWKECEYCQSENIQRVVAMIGSKVDQDKYQKKVGDLVKSHIEQSKEEVKQEKQKLKRKVYEDD